MTYFCYIILFVFGLAIGSFINVVVLRYRPNQKLLDIKIIGGRSKCPICHKMLAWYELIPVFSFLFQKGKCRHCGHLISLQYPFVEIFSGLIFVFVPMSLLAVGSQLPIIAVWILIFLLFLLLSVIDFRQHVIPNSINLLLAILGVTLIFLNFQSSIFSVSFLEHYAMLFNFWPLSFENNQWLLVVNPLFSALLAMSFFGAIIILSRGRAMGWGDFKLIGALGLIFSWPDILMILFLSFLAGSIFSLPFLIAGKKRMKDSVPFGPFLVIGSVLVFFFGFEIINGYFKLFGL